VTFTHHDQRDQILAGSQTDARTPAASRPCSALRLVEADGLARRSTQHDLALTVGDRHPDQLIVVVQVDRNDPAGTRPRERASGVFFTVPARVA